MDGRSNDPARGSGMVAELWSEAPSVRTVWAKAGIAHNCGVGTHDGADEYINGLVALGP